MKKVCRDGIPSRPGIILFLLLFLLPVLPAVATGDCTTYTNHSGHVPGSYDYAVFIEGDTHLTVYTFGNNIYVNPADYGAGATWQIVKKCHETTTTSSTSTTSTTSTTTSTTSTTTTSPQSTTTAPTTSIPPTSTSQPENTTSSTTPTTSPADPPDDAEVLPFTGAEQVAAIFLGVVFFGFGVTGVRLARRMS